MATATTTTATATTLTGTAPRFTSTSVLSTGVDDLINNRNRERDRALERRDQDAAGARDHRGRRGFQRFSQASSDDGDDPDDPDDHRGTANDDSDEGGDAEIPPELGFKPTDGERMFMKESARYVGNMPFDSFLKKFSHLADLCTVRPAMFKSCLYMKISGPVGALVVDMTPDRPKYAKMTGKQYANAIKSRLEPVTEKRLLYQQFLARTQQTGESVDLYVLDKHNLFKRSSITKTRNFEDFVDYTIRGFLNAYLKKKVRESCVMKVPRTFIQFRKLVNINVTLIQARLQSGEIDATEAVGCEVRLFSYSYVDSNTAGTKTDTAEGSSRYFPAVKVKTEPVSALAEAEDGAEADDETEDSINWVGRRRGGPTRFAAGAQKTTTFTGSKRSENSRFGARRPPQKPSSEACFHCGMEGHWKGECPRRLHGFPKSVNAIGGTDSSSSEEEEKNEVNVLRGDKSQIALLSERVDRLFDLVGEGRGRKTGKAGRFPMKTDPQKERNDGVSFLE